MKKQKELKKFRENLQVGDKIVTIGGIHGKILEVSDTTVLLSCESSTKLRVEKSAVSQSFDEQAAVQGK
jgi:preprotein translocase subunit YajC